MLFKTSWHQEHIDRWTREFGHGAEIICRIIMLNVENRSALSRKKENGNMTGRCLVDTKSRKSQEIWVLIRVSEGVLLVNERTGAHIVAQGWRGPVACTHDVVDTNALWELDCEAGHMMFRNKQFHECSLDLSNESGFHGAPLYNWTSQEEKQQKWTVTETAVLSI